MRWQPWLQRAAVYMDKSSLSKSVCVCVYRSRAERYQREAKKLGKLGEITKLERNKASHVGVEGEKRKVSVDPVTETPKL